jgi:hypothetical protein
MWGRVKFAELSINDGVVAAGEVAISTLGLFAALPTSRGTVLPRWLPRKLDVWVLRVLEPLIRYVERDSRGRSSPRSGLERLAPGVDSRVSVMLRDGARWYFLSSKDHACFRIRDDDAAARRERQIGHVGSSTLRLSGRPGMHVVLMSSGDQLAVDVFFPEGQAPREQHRLELPAEVVVTAPASC